MLRLLQFFITAFLPELASGSSTSQWRDKRTFRVARQRIFEQKDRTLLILVQYSVPRDTYYSVIISKFHLR